MSTDHGFLCRSCGVLWLAEEEPPYASPTWLTPAIPAVLLQHRAVLAQIGRVLAANRSWGDAGPLQGAVAFLAAHEEHEVVVCDEYGRHQPEEP